MKKEDMEIVQKICELLDMTLTDEGGGSYDLSFSSNYGEDFHIGIRETDEKTFMSDLYDTVFDFDPEKHAVEWYGANRGEPHSIRALLYDADYIANELDHFRDYCARYFGQHWEWEDIKREILNDQYLGRV